MHVKDLILKINEYSAAQIKNISEVSVLMESAFVPGKSDEFKNLIFTAKYIKGLRSVLSNKNINGDKYIEKIFDEFNKNLQRFLDTLKKIISNSDENSIIQFESKYFRMNQESIVNTMELIDDLSLCKEYFNNYSRELS